MKKEKVVVDMEVDDNGEDEVASMEVDQGQIPEPNTPPPPTRRSAKRKSSSPGVRVSHLQT